MNLVYKRPKGFADIYGSMAEQFTRMESAARTVFVRYDFKELRTPILESTDLFRRSIGTDTDVVQKEMFTFPDRKGRSLTLRPEATAGVLRSCMEEGLAQSGQIARFFTMGPMFRYERPQKGRMRQFHQINCECLGTGSPYADAEIICMLLDFLHALGLSGLLLKLNSLGCRECRPPYIERLRGFLMSIPEEALCPDCLRRREANPLRVLDCKVPGCKTQLQDAPRLLAHNCAECSKHFEKTVSLLESQGVVWELDHHLVRGLDYYQRTTFEVVSNEIGSQTAVAGGGRYDGLLAQLGGADLPGIGFACGMERLGLLLKQERLQPLDFYMLPLQCELVDAAFALAQELRRHGYSGEMNYRPQSFKAGMRQADRSEARFCFLLGPDEAMAGNVTIKNMLTGQQTLVAQKDVLARFADLLASA